MTLRPEMMNSMGNAHGAITYALADCAFGFTSNTHGKKSVSLDTSISHIEALVAGDYITAECTVDKTKTKIGFYIVEVKKGEDLVALFKGVAYRTKSEWD